MCVLKMRIAPANTKSLFCRMMYSHTQDSHPMRHSISNCLLTLLCKVLATMFRYKIMYLSF